MSVADQRTVEERPKLPRYARLGDHLAPQRRDLRRTLLGYQYWPA